MKALASVKNGYEQVSIAVNKLKSKEFNHGFFTEIISKVVEIENTKDGITYFTVESLLAAKNYLPGQFFKIQNFNDKLEHQMEPLALSPIHVDKLNGMLRFKVKEVGKTTKLCARLKIGERISMMGPAGDALSLVQNKTILLITDDFTSELILPLEKELQRNNPTVEKVVTNGSDIEAIRRKILKLDPGSSFIYLYASSEIVDYFRDLTDYTIIVNLNLPMQCMMKGICGQCICKVEDDRKYIFACQIHDLQLKDIDSKTSSTRLKINNLLEKLP